MKKAATIWATVTGRGLRVVVRDSGRTISGVLMDAGHDAVRWLGGTAVQVDLFHHGTAQAMRDAILRNHTTLHNVTAWECCDMLPCVAARAFDAAHRVQP